MMAIKKKTGFTLPLVLLISAILAIMILAMTRSLKMNSTYQSVNDNMNVARRRAESSMLQALGQLSIDGTVYETNAAFDDEQTDGTTKWSVHTFRRNFSDVSGGYYIITQATSTFGGKRYSCQLHTYARVSNVGDYFMAVNGDASADVGINLSNAKIYGTNLYLTTGGHTPILKAEYVQGHICMPDPNGTNAASDYSAGVIDIAEPNSDGPTGRAHRPQALPFELLFPQLLDADMQRYQSKAHLDTGTGHKVCDFRSWGDIYPPGYYTVSAPVGDPYTSPPSGASGHSSINADHIYYCPETSSTGGVMYIKGIVHGQVLFVADKEIHITGNLTVGNAAGDLAVPPATTLPGTGSSGNPGVSTAHQAVLLTRKDVIVDKYPATTPTSNVTQKIQALVFAPQGTILTTVDAAYRPFLRLEFTGAMILNATPNFAATFSDGNRIYAYMNSLKTNPPPDLPALSEIYYSFEDTTGVNY